MNNVDSKLKFEEIRNAKQCYHCNTTIVVHQSNDRIVWRCCQYYF
jgi:hypothetical protein